MVVNYMGIVILGVVLSFSLLVFVGKVLVLVRVGEVEG